MQNIQRSRKMFQQEAHGPLSAHLGTMGNSVISWTS